MAGTVLNRARQFLSWWWRELAALMPVTLSQAVRARSPTLVLAVGKDDIRIIHRVNDRDDELGFVARAVPGAAVRNNLGAVAQPITRHWGKRLDPAHTRVMVTAGPELALRKVLDLPLAVEENPAQALAFQVERETPFRNEDVYFDFRIIARDPRGQRVRIQFDIIPRSIADEALALVGDWDLQPVPGCAVETGAERRGFCFHPRRYHPAATTRLNSALVAGNIVLLLAVIFTHFASQERTLEALHSELARVRGTAEKSAILQGQVNEIEAEILFFAQRRAARPAMVEVLEELSALLPDSTWLYRLEIKNGAVHLQGVSESASALIVPLETSALFDQVRFGAPLTQETLGGREHFQLSADLAPGKARGMLPET